MPRIRTCPGRLAHYTPVGNTLLLTLWKELRPVLWAARWHSCKAAGEQGLEWWQCPRID